MGKRKLKHYKNPIDQKIGKQYFVPCVIKNKYALIYYILGVNQCAHDVVKQMPDARYLQTNLMLDSLRFNDILPDGKKIHNLTDADYDKMEAELEERSLETHPDNDTEVDEQFFGLNCPNCGNHYVFNNPNEIPEKDFNCGLCDRVLIDYTNNDDWEYEYYEA